MTTTLSEGVKVPDVGSVNWAGDLEVNWNLLNGALANLSFNVKLDRDNIWTGTQTFLLPVEGSINGTASKAIADEDGTSIKSGYVNVAGNQTVTGDKSFTGSNTFNNILPNATNTYSLGSSSYQWSSVYAQSYYYNGTEFSRKFVTTDTEQTITSIKTISRYNARINLNNTNIIKGVIPSSNTTSQYYFGDSTGAETGRLMYRALSDGTRQLWIAVNDNYLNGTLDPTGMNKWNNLFINLEPTGHRVIAVETDDVIPNTNNINLGTSTNQWSSVYAQTYYYNGTAWGLDKANVWTGNNTFSSVIKQSINSIYSQTPASDRFAVHEFNGTDNNRIFTLNCADRSSGQREISLIVYDTDGTFKASGIFKESDGTFSFRARSNNEINLGTSTNKWKTLNGVNPGALSFPDASKAVTVDTTNYTWTGSDNTYIAPANGWLSLKTTTGLSGRLEGTTTGIGSIVERSAGGRLVLLHIPVLSGEGVTVSGVGSDFILKFYPCLGNV